jgi:hypothetical protein
MLAARGFPGHLGLSSGSMFSPSTPPHAPQLTNGFRALLNRQSTTKFGTWNFSDVADAAISQPSPATKPRWRLRSRAGATLCDWHRQRIATLANSRWLNFRPKPSACGTSSTASLLVLATRLNRGPGRTERQSLRLHHAEPSRALAMVPRASERDLRT